MGRGGGCRGGNGSRGENERCVCVRENVFENVREKETDSWVALVALSHFD